MTLVFDQLAALSGNRFGTVDVPCPLCAPRYNAKKKVLRIWRDDELFIRFSCARCGEKGWSRDGARPGAVRP